MSTDIKSLIPRNKYDLDAVSAVKEAGYPAIAPILDELMQWTADGNWPVARPLAAFLSTIGEPVIEPILRVLRGNDPTFKWFCIITMVQILPADILKALEGDLRKLAENPSRLDKLEGVDEEAEKALRRLPS